MNKLKIYEFKVTIDTYWKDACFMIVIWTKDDEYGACLEPNAYIRGLN